MFTKIFSLFPASTGAPHAPSRPPPLPTGYVGDYNYSLYKCILTSKVAYMYNEESIMYIVKIHPATNAHKVAMEPTNAMHTFLLTHFPSPVGSRGWTRRGVPTTWTTALAPPPGTDPKYCLQGEESTLVLTVTCMENQFLGSKVRLYLIVGCVGWPKICTS